VEQPVEQPVEEPAYVEQPVEEPVVDQPVEEPAQEPAAAVTELTFDDSNVKVLPSDQIDNASGLNVLRVQVAAASLQPVAGDDGTFGFVSVSDSESSAVISLEDPADPSVADPSIVAVRAMSADELAQNGWAEGTQLFINLGDTMKNNVIDMSYIDVMNLTLAKKDESGNVVAKGMLNKSVMVGKDEIGLTFDNSDDIRTFTAGNTVSGHIMLPDEAEGIAYTAYIDENPAISFTMNDATSFSAVLNTAGAASVTVEVSSDGGESYIPYTFSIPVIPAG